MSGNREILRKLMMDVYSTQQNETKMRRCVLLLACIEVEDEDVPGQPCYKYIFTKLLNLKVSLWIIFAVEFQFNHMEFSKSWSGTYSAWETQKYLLAAACKLRMIISKLFAQYVLLIDVGCGSFHVVQFVLNSLESFCTLLV